MYRKFPAAGNVNSAGKMKPVRVRLRRKLRATMTSGSRRLRLAIRPRPVAHTLLICLLGVLACPTASAQISERTVKQFVHTTWGEKEGAPGGILALAQTQDGYLAGNHQRLTDLMASVSEQFKPQSGRASAWSCVFAIVPALMAIFGSASMTERSAA